MAKKEEKLSLEQILEQLDGTIEKLQSGEVSLEDLWAFNTELVAQAVFDCSVPIISAVGHETDTTIIDFVSDLRAPTPSAAAELAVFDVSYLLEQLNGMQTQLQEAMRQKIYMAKMQMGQKEQLLKSLSPMAMIREKKFQCIRCEEVLNEIMNRKIRDKKHQLQLQIERLGGLSPLQKLQQGYSYVADNENKNIRSISQIKEDDILRVYVTDGAIVAKVQEVQKIER